VKRLNAIETKNPQAEDKRMMTTFNKNFYRLPARIDSEPKFSQTEPYLSRCQTKSRIKKSFEQYYTAKNYEDLNSMGDTKDGKAFKFRDILTEMNGRVKNIKKHRIRRD
jgi:hypothetical protein